MIVKKSNFFTKGRGLALAVLMAAPAMGPLAAAAEEGRLTVVGTATVAQSPDVARISLGVSTQDETAAAALSQNSTAMQAVLDRLKAAGLAEADIQTSGLTVGPTWVYPQDGAAPKVTGYSANNSVTARVSDLDNLGKVLDAVVKDGANQLNGISFDLQNPKPVMDEARKAAIADARAKAALMAEAAGVKLGKVLHIQEGGNFAPRPEMRMAMPASDAGVPVAQGEVSLEATVTIIYEIE